ncbi:hypothetical protein ACFQY5_08330 [Paeniroseomonas aquatica]|uniref:hypothetical protein n=1 Tax=Paeniroseomonas aquatica TaxID=373043 RepID=UPI00360DAC78
MPVLDPVNHRAWTIRHPFAHPETPSMLDEPRGPSPFWGETPIWDGHTSNHNLIMDQHGLVWFAARIRPAGAQPAWCQTGGDHPSARVAPIAAAGRHLSVYDPKTQQFDLIDTCFGTHHLYFGYDPDNTLWTSWGGASGAAVGWLNTRRYLETRDAKASQGWAPMVVDVPGWGRRGDYVEADQPLDLAKQKRIIAGFYGVQPSPTDGSIWGQSMDIGFSRNDQPGYLIRFIPGPDPTNTGLTEVFQPPAGSFSPRGIDVDSKGVVWTTLGSGHLASFDRSKCRAPLTGPAAATGRQCEEGWTLHRFPGPGRRRRPGRQRRPRLLRLGRPLQHAWPRRRRTHRLHEWQRVADRSGGWHIAPTAGALSGRLLHQECRWPDRRSQCRLAWAWRLDHHGHADAVP